MKGRVQRWGNSLAVRIPKSLADEIGLEKETPVELTATDNKLVVSPTRKPKLKLEDLLAKVTDENIHGEIDTGASVGNEAW